MCDKKDHDFYRCLNLKECEYCEYKPNQIDICSEPNLKCLYLTTKDRLIEVLSQMN